MLEGIKKLISQKVDEHDARKTALKFATDFIEVIYREQCRINKREYSEFLSELNKIKGIAKIK